MAKTPRKKTARRIARRRGVMYSEIPAFGQAYEYLQRAAEINRDAPFETMNNPNMQLSRLLDAYALAAYATVAAENDEFERVYREMVDLKKSVIRSIVSVILRAQSDSPGTQEFYARVQGRRA